MYRLQHKHLQKFYYEIFNEPFPDVKGCNFFFMMQLQNETATDSADKSDF
jgi:hypothetical protein